MEAQSLSMGLEHNYKWVYKRMAAMNYIDSGTFYAEDDDAAKRYVTKLRNIGGWGNWLREHNYFYKTDGDTRVSHGLHANDKNAPLYMVMLWRI